MPSPVKPKRSGSLRTAAAPMIGVQQAVEHQEEGGRGRRGEDVAERVVEE
jgi:hypothetical protein